MILRIFHKGFNYSQDGTGNRLVYHLQGCNLRCPWCSNPEGMDAAGPAAAVSIDELLEETRRCRPMFFDAGGVTFTGGEATCQFEALKAALLRLREEGVSAALETNGTHPRLPELFPLLDELILDFKHPDARRHREVTGRGNEAVRRNLARAFGEHPRLLVRIPLIGGFNTAPDVLDRFMAFFDAQDTARARFEILCYHEYGREKWTKLGRPYTVTDAFVPEETRRLYEDTMRGRGLRVVRT